MQTRTIQTTLLFSAIVASGFTAPILAQNSAVPANAPAQSPPAAATSSQGPMGYLPRTAAPSSVALVPPPPAAGSAAMAEDEAVNRSALAVQGTPRWEMAANDAVLTMPAVLQSFSCALGVPVGPDKTPKLIGLMRRVLVDAGSSTSEAKDRYQRTRPFVVNGKPTCTPTAEDRLRNNGSYPSGHAAIGYAFGLVLSQVAPDRGDALVARGTAFAESRLVCNVHWESDVEQGQLMAAAVVARFNAQVSFRNDVDSARAEVEALRAQGAKVERNCEAESQALKPWK